MQKAKPLSGPLKTRFFAWAQMFEIEVARTNDLVKNLKLTPMQEAHVFTDLTQSGLIIQLMRGRYLVPNKLPAGPWVAPSYRIIEVLMRELKAEYQVTGLAAFNSYGLDRQVPNEIAVYNTKLSGRRIIGGLSFLFIKVPKSRLGGHKGLKVDKTQVVFGTFARTIMDAVYDYSRFATLPKAYEWIYKLRDNPDFLTELMALSARHSNQSTCRRLGYLLEEMGHPKIAKELKSVVNRKTKAFIPLVPNRGRAGATNRDWGVIVNYQFK